MTRGSIPDTLLKRWLGIISILASLYAVSAWAINQTTYLQETVGKVLLLEGRMGTVEQEQGFQAMVLCRLLRKIEGNGSLPPRCTQLLKDWGMP